MFSVLRKYTEFKTRWTGNNKRDLTVNDKESLWKEVRVARKSRSVLEADSGLP